MKNKPLLMRLITALFFLPALLLVSCDKDDDFTVENKQVTGDLTFVQTSFIPLSFDSTGLIPLSAQITQTGEGTVEEIGDVLFDTNFKIDLVTGMGYDFVITYTGTSPGDTFITTGTSQVQPNGSFVVQENLGSGTGKFSKISGNGTTTVWLNQALDAGTAVIEWTVTY